MVIYRKKARKIHIVTAGEIHTHLHREKEK